MQPLTYSNSTQENQFSFVCPIFDAPTKLANCMKLRELVWMGRKVDARLGCQACMKSSMCPAAEIVNQGFRKKFQTDEYGSTEPVLGKLHADVLQKIVNVVPQTNHLTLVPEAERDLILSSQLRIAKQLGVAPKADAPKRRQVVSSRAKVAKARPVEDVKDSIEINQAAATGDMSAAINQGEA